MATLQSVSFTTAVNCLTSAIVVSKYWFVLAILSIKAAEGSGVLPCCVRCRLDSFVFQVLISVLY